MKVLVANRGEIAVRVLRALKEMSLKSVLVYSEEDRDSPSLRLADEVWCIGPAAPAESYLHFQRILTAARLSGAKALHPGYGFLSENGLFAQACEEAGLLFIGPKSSVLLELSDKAKTKALVAKAGVPTIPGKEGAMESLAQAQEAAFHIGYPVLLKASFGGGGRGIYLVESPKDLERAYSQAATESRSATGRSELYLEKYLKDTRHVEVQVARDFKGNIQTFVERDCTIQRRNQKLLEETPSPFVDAACRAQMMKAAAKAVEACHLTTLATVECLLMPDRETFYFMEINKRIQVEHPITEELLGLDLVQMQMAIALGETLQPNPAGASVSSQRHSMEVRINAEDPGQDFLPDEGFISCYMPPGGPGVRVDSYLTHGVKIGASYDSLLAKLIATSPYGRKAAISKLKNALQEFEIQGVATTIAFYIKLLSEEKFFQGKDWFSAKFLESWLPQQKFNPN